MQVTGDDLVKGVAGFIGFILTSVTGWLFVSVLKLREDGVTHQLKHQQLQEKVADLEEGQLTRECIREEIETALTKRDKEAEKRNEERAILRRLEMKAIVNDVIESAIPRIVHEVKGNTGIVKLQLPPESNKS